MHHLYADKKKNREKELYDNYTRLIRAVLNKSRKQDTTTPAAVPPISQTIQVR